MEINIFFQHRQALHPTLNKIQVPFPLPIRHPSSVGPRTELLWTCNGVDTELNTTSSEMIVSGFTPPSLGLLKLL